METMLSLQEVYSLLDFANAWIASYGYENMPQSKRELVSKLLEVSSNLEQLLGGDFNG